MDSAFHRVAGMAILLAAVGAGPAQAQLLAEGEESSVGLTEDRDLLPEQERERGLPDQVNVGTVEDEQVLAGEEEGPLRGAGVGLREDESGVGEVPRGPAPGLERDD